MAEPTIVPRSQHAISRRDVDPDALKVLYRLHEHHYVAYLVGGSVRDLLLERRPKDFDIGTSAHPHQVKKLFRNCWIIGRRFRLAHVKFGTKTIEVATFRRHVPASELTPEAEIAELTSGRPAAAAHRRRAAAAAGGRPSDPAGQHLRHARRGRVPPRLHGERALLRHRHLLDHRLRRRVEGSRRAPHPLHRRSRGAFPGRSRAHAAGGRPGRAAAIHDRRTGAGGDRGAPPRDLAQRAGPAGRGVLQDSAIGARRRRAPSAADDGLAEGDHAGARGGRR